MKLAIKSSTITVTLTVLLTGLLLSPVFAESKAQKPTPDAALTILKDGNQRFVTENQPILMLTPKG